jgi:membrane associated rhomboid family serine protease
MLTELIQFIKRNFQRPNNGVIQLIIIHALVFIILVIAKAICVLFGYENYYRVIYQYLVLPANWNSFLHQPWSIFTYFWIQQEFFSIIWNSLFLYAFGQLIVTLWDSRVLKRIYILGGIVAGILFLLIYNLVPSLHSYAENLVGPSGNLYAVMVAAAIVLPNFYFRLLFLGSIKIRYIAAILLLLACFEVGSHQAIGIAHLAGGLAGYIYVKFLNKFFKYNSILSYFSNISRRKIKFKVSYQRNTEVKPVTRPKSGNQEQIDIDAILDKIAVQGYESLTDQEKQQLFRAGK